MDTTTQYPVVLIHGVFGYGRSRPLWNRFAPYWPEQHLAQLNANHIIVDVGALSSDHDRACEAFYQLVGGRVDYGEQHAREAGHNRFGITFDTPLLAHWNADHPVHLVGHSFGATTAIELYQLICLDYFRVGSDHRWVRSIVSIAGPLSGTTLTHVFGLHDASMRAFTLGHAIGAALAIGAVPCRFDSDATLHAHESFVRHCLRLPPLWYLRVDNWYDVGAHTLYNATAIG